MAAFKKAYEVVVEVDVAHFAAFFHSSSWAEFDRGKKEEFSSSI